MKKILYVALALALTASLFGCKKKTIADYTAKHGVDFGFAVSTGDLLDEKIQKIIEPNAKILVAENCMKSALLRPNKTFWNWSDPENLIKFAEKNKMAPKWHTLFWHQQNPPFISSLKNSDEAQKMMDEHITTILQKYKGRVRDYDVVNEMFEEDGSFRENVWLKTLGPTYIERALRKAHEVDPGAHLFLNEYNNEAKGYPKADAMYELAKTLVESGVPLYGIGMQLHLAADLPYDEDAIRQNIRRYADLGLKVCFSEVDVRLPLSKADAYKDSQKDVYKSLMKLALEEPNVESFIVWGISDKNSWVPAAFPGYGDALLFDREFKEKELYNALLETAKNAK